jgi:hypothetical protein
MLDPSIIIALLPMMEKKRVSLVARGRQKSRVTKQGFLEWYLSEKKDLTALATKNETWIERRKNFLARHAKGRLWTRSGEPTRHHLSLIAWAYTPDEKKLTEYIESRGLINQSLSGFLGKN